MPSVRLKTRVTLVQTSGDGRDPSQDLDCLLDELRAHRDSDLVVFPEFAIRQPTHSESAARQLASVGPAVAFGELRVGPEGSRNLATYADALGTRSYAKTHVHWTEGFVPGTEYPVVDTPLGPTGMLICFDAAFAEVPLALSLGGAKAILNLSAIPSHFPLKIVHRRLVACSVLNQVFTFFVNRAGEGYLGGSAIVDPQGEIIALAGAQDRSLTMEIDMSEVDAWRAAEPVRAFRRPEMYGEIAKARPVAPVAGSERAAAAPLTEESRAASY